MSGRGIEIRTGLGPSPTTHDPVNSPSHYNSHPSGVECVEITRHYSCMIGSAMKYLWRSGLKNNQDNPARVDELQDLNKALWCIMEEIDRLGGEVTARPREKMEG